MNQNNRNNANVPDDLRFNNEKRLPVCIVVDGSSSMRRKDGSQLSRLERVRQGINQLYAELAENETTASAVEVAVVSFADFPTIVQNFMTVDNLEDIEELPCGGNTDLGGGVLTALTLLNERKELYKRAGTSYFQPWLIIFSDGRPFGKDAKFIADNLAAAQRQATEDVNDKKLTVYPVFIGDFREADDDPTVEELDKEANKFLEAFSPKQKPIILGSAKLSSFFKFLSQSFAGETRGAAAPAWVESDDWDDEE